jgi:hypothetical protein
VAHLKLQYQEAWERLKNLLRQCPIDLQTKHAILGHIFEMLRSVVGLSEVAFSCHQSHGQYLTELAKHLASRVANQGKGPGQKHERVLERRKAIDRARDMGITDDEGIYAFMKEHHPELIRKGRRGLVSADHMMRDYRESRKT